MREKLIELIEESTGCTYGGEYGDEVVENEIDISYSEIERIADHLIANGVVVSKMETTTDKDTNVPSKVVPHKVDTDHVHVGSGIWRRGTTVYKCPKCQTFVMRYCKYCFECGQALEWQTEPPKGE